MTLVFLYGPPAAGKLTVARELARLTGLRVFHNHLTIDLAREIFPQRDEGYGKLVERTRLVAMETAAEMGVSMVFTFVYAAGADDPFVARVREAVERYGGRVLCVGLLPSRAALRARVEADSRQATSKIKTWARLESLLDDHDVLTPIPGGLVIDNSNLSPEDVAARIASAMADL